MAKKPTEHARRTPSEADKAPTPSSRGIYQSGIVDKAMVEKLRRMAEPEPWRAGEDPPWSVVERYLAAGEHRKEIEEHASRSRAFADVLTALRHDDEERDDVADAEPASAKAVGAEPPESPQSHGKRPSYLRIVR